jgi:hypothetical protein
MGTWGVNFTKMTPFVIFVKFGVHCHCFGSLRGKLSQLIVWGVDCHWGGSLRGLSGLYPNFYVSISDVKEHPNNVPKETSEESSTTTKASLRNNNSLFMLQPTTCENSKT